MQKLWISFIIIPFSAYPGKVGAVSITEQKKVDFTNATIVVSKQSKESFTEAIKVT